MKKTVFSSLFCLVLVIGFSQEVRAQEGVGQIFKDVVSDPTTYVPTGFLWTSFQADWNTSQPLFAQGYVEANPLFTVSGRPYSRPISFADGNRKIAMLTLRDGLGISMLINTGIRVGEHLLISQHPEKKRLIHSAGWVARIGFAALQGYLQSHEHFAQWQENKRMVAALQ